jgi:hypothetical protein
LVFALADLVEDIGNRRGAARCLCQITEHRDDRECVWAQIRENVLNAWREDVERFKIDGHSNLKSRGLVDNRDEPIQECMTVLVRP